MKPNLLCPEQSTEQPVQTENFFWGVGSGRGVCRPRKEPNLMEHGETAVIIMIIILHGKFSMGYLHCMADFSKEELEQQQKETHGVKITG